MILPEFTRQQIDEAKRTDLEWRQQPDSCFNITYWADSPDKGRRYLVSPYLYCNEVAYRVSVAHDHGIQCISSRFSSALYTPWGGMEIAERHETLVSKGAKT